jgi:hypothetical protein
MNSQLLAQLAEKKNLAPSLSRAQLARNLSSHFRRAAAAAAASAPAPVLDDDAKTSVACVQVYQKTHPERAPQFRGKVTKSEQRQRHMMCVQQPRGNYIAQTGPGYSAQWGRASGASKKIDEKSALK